MTSQYSDELNNKLATCFGMDGATQLIQLGNDFATTANQVDSMYDGSASGLQVADALVTTTLTMFAGSTIATSGSGFKIGAAASSKIGLWGKTPVILPTKTICGGFRSGGWTTHTLASALAAAGVLSQI